MPESDRGMLLGRYCVRRSRPAAHYKVGWPRTMCRGDRGQPGPQTRPDSGGPLVGRRRGNSLPNALLFENKWSGLKRTNRAPSAGPNSLDSCLMASRRIINISASMAALAPLLTQWCGHECRSLMHAAVFNVVPSTTALFLLGDPGEPTNQSWAGLFSQCRHGILLISMRCHVYLVSTQAGIEVTGVTL